MTQPALKKRSKPSRGQELKSKTSIMLDSGAWSAYTQKDPIDIDEYIKFVKEHEHLLDIYVNLDVINDGEASYKNWLYMKAAGLNPLPVYHMEDDRGQTAKWLYKYLEKTDYVAIGAIANKSVMARKMSLDRLWEDHLVDNQGYPIAKFHGFGLTSNVIMTRYPWFSVDSTSWVQYGKFGIVLVPGRTHGEYDYTKTVRKYVVSKRSPSKTAVVNTGRRNPHIDNLGEDEREQFEEYIKEKGHILGESEWSDDKEVILVRGLRNDHHLRDEINMDYFLDLEASLPEWPWSFKPRRRRLL